MKFQIEKRIIGVFIFALITLFAFGFYSKESITDLIEISRQAEHTQKILQKLYVILSNVTDAETGQRGYIITGDERWEAVARKFGRLPLHVGAEVVFLRSLRPLWHEVLWKISRLAGLKDR
jgi:membrane-bound ClpP family serine protease